MDSTQKILLAVIILMSFQLGMMTGGYMVTQIADSAARKANWDYLMNR